MIPEGNRCLPHRPPCEVLLCLHTHGQVMMLTLCIMNQSARSLLMKIRAFCVRADPNMLTWSPSLFSLRLRMRCAHKAQDHGQHPHGTPNAQLCMQHVSGDLISWSESIECTKAWQDAFKRAMPGDPSNPAFVPPPVPNTRWN